MIQSVKIAPKHLNVKDHGVLCLALVGCIADFTIIFEVFICKIMQDSSFFKVTYYLLTMSFNIKCSISDCRLTESKPSCEVDFISSGSDVIMVPVKRALRLRCTVRYAGNWAPTTEWKKQNSTAVVDIEVRRIVINGTVTLTTILMVSSNSAIGSRYVYELRFDESRRPNLSTAENVPGYYYTWLSPSILQADPDDASPEGSKFMSITVASLINI